MPDGTCPLKRRTGQKAKTQQAQISLEQTQSPKGPWLLQGEEGCKTTGKWGSWPFPPGSASPASRELREQLLNASLLFHRLWHRAVCWARTRAVPVGLGAASRVQEHSPGSASQSRMTSSQMWGWLGQVAGVGPWGQVEVGTRWPMVVLSADAGVRRAHPDFLFYPMWLYGCR